MSDEEGAMYSSQMTGKTQHFKHFNNDRHDGVEDTPIDSTS